MRSTIAGSDKGAARKLTSADKEQLQEEIDKYRKQKWKPSLRKRPFLREHIGVSGLIGAGIVSIESQGSMVMVR